MARGSRDHYKYRAYGCHNAPPLDLTTQLTLTIPTTLTVEAILHITSTCYSDMPFHQPLGARVSPYPVSFDLIDSVPMVLMVDIQERTRYHTDDPLEYTSSPSMYSVEDLACSSGPQTHAHSERTPIGEQPQLRGRWSNAHSHRPLHDTI